MLDTEKQQQQNKQKTQDFAQAVVCLEFTCSNFLHFFVAHMGIDNRSFQIQALFIFGIKRYPLEGVEIIGA